MALKPQITVGDSPLLLAQPHGGTEISESIFQRLNACGQALADTDWHISRLYDGLIDNVTIVRTPVHRYVVDANRGPADETLYPGQNTTGLCPLTTFDGEPIYRRGEEPGEDEIRERQLLYHQPYHDSLLEQLERLRQKHGYAILYDCHSIRSVVPYLFEGRLPDLNIGTHGGASCGWSYQSAVENICSGHNRYTWVLNGRFRGGWTTRHYGDPAAGVHAIQMELAQCNYMREQAPWSYHEALAGRLRPVLRKILNALLVAG